MKRFLFLICLGSTMILVSCFFRDEKPVVTKASEVLVKPAESKSVVSMIKKKDAQLNTDKNKALNVIARYFEKADAIHREAWWVMSAERRPVGKSPFGKIHRALLSSQNIKLPNKSIFRCDRYIVRRDVGKADGFPQKAEIFEKCSERIEAKKIGQFFAHQANEIQVVFFPENLEEILGLGATVINKSIQCTLRGNDREQLVSLICKDWAQERSKEHMIRLDVYDYEMEGRNLIKLRGKVYENLSEARKIEADVPMEGKIFVTETELYPPEPSPEPQAPAPVKVVNPGAQAKKGIPIVPLSPNIAPGLMSPVAKDQVIDPDVLMQQQQQLQQLPVLQSQGVEQLPNEDFQQQQLQSRQQPQPQPQQMHSQPQVPLQQWNPNANAPQPGVLQPGAEQVPGAAVPENPTENPTENPEENSTELQQEVQSGGHAEGQQSEPPNQGNSNPEIPSSENPKSENPIPAGGVYGR